MNVFPYWDLLEESELFFLCQASQVQDPYRFCYRYRAHALAEQIVEPSGEINREKVHEMEGFFQKNGFVLSPNEDETAIRAHFLYVLKKLKEESFLRKIKRFTKPLFHAGADRLIRESLDLSSPIETVHIRKAVISACLTPLRQTVGSCFATAPAIAIQRENLDLFVEDLYQMLMLGKIVRVMEGVEYAAPMSPSSGGAELKVKIGLFRKEMLAHSPALLRALVAAGVISDGFKSLKKILFSYREASGMESIGDLIEEVILDSEKVTGKEWGEFIKREESVSLPSPFTTPKGRALFQLKEKIEAAKAAFKSFADHPLLKAWEFTLASFSEVKMDFSNWNLYSSLGLHHEEKGGIGALLYREINQKFVESNAHFQNCQNNLERAFHELKAVERLLSMARSESEAKRFFAEWQAKRYHFDACQELVDKEEEKVRHYGGLFALLISEYCNQFPKYFQEIYDADMQEVTAVYFEDLPAGFRLCYKHGRTATSSWSFIRSSEEWVQALVYFFLATENALAEKLSWKGAKEELTALVGQIIFHVRSEEFLETALLRCARAHRGSLKEKKPWAYISGGNLGILLQNYFGYTHALLEEKSWVESSQQLLIFFLDVFKALPPRITQPFLDNPRRALFCHSPTHAFLLYPGYEAFSRGWQDSGFTYTWVRDQHLIPGRIFYEKQTLSFSQQQYLVQRFAPQKEALFSYEQVMTVVELRDRLLQLAPSDRVDSFLFESLPLFSTRDLKDLLAELLFPLFREKLSISTEKIQGWEKEWIDASSFLELCYEVIRFSIQKPYFDRDIKRTIVLRARHLGFLAPEPLIFADTNWPSFYFAFLVGPAAEQLELWRVNALGSKGSPMHMWKDYLNGAKKEPWGIFLP